MFEKEAEELFKKKPLGYEMKPELEIYTDGFKDGYNKAKEDADKMKSQFLELCNLKDMRIVELNKVNEWHYPSKGDFPKSEGSYYVAMDNGRGYKSGAILNWVEETDCEEDFHWEDDEYECYDEQVYAWKECPVLPPKEIK